MKTQQGLRVRVVPVSEPLAIGHRYDYADAYEVQLPVPDVTAPEAWLRAGLADVPPVVDRIAALLGVHDTPDTASHLIAGGRVVESTSDVIHVEFELPLMHVTLVGRRKEPDRRVLTTLLTFQRPVLGRLAWVFVRVGHRLTARRLLRRTATLASNGSGRAERAG